MKKTAIMLFLLLIILFCGFSLTQKEKGQKLTGFIGVDPYFDIVPESFVSAVQDGKKGINLDYADSSNPHRYLISPTTNILTVEGVRIGQLSLLVSSIGNNISSIRLIIEHDHLINQEVPNAKIDYELALKYTLSRSSVNPSGGSQHSEEDFLPVFCLSSDSENAYVDSSKKAINVLFSISQDSIIAIQNAGLYFRLTKDSPVSVQGQYHSTATLTLEVE